MCIRDRDAEELSCGFEVNLNYPGLATVKALHEAGDATTALKELLAYYRNIKNPNVTSDPRCV